MTTIQTTLKRETAGRYRSDALVIELNPRYLAMRTKGARTRYTLDYETLFDYMQKREALAALRDQAAKRKRPRGAR
jgi:hypothetical protein